MSATEVKNFLSWLANNRDVSINTPIVFLYHKHLKIELGDLGFTLATKQRQLPRVLNPEEISAILQHLNDRDRLIIALLYGSGLRITEYLRLRVMDINFEGNSISVHNGKGNTKPHERYLL